MTIVELAGEMVQQMEWKKRSNGDKYVCFKNGAPEWMNDMAHEVHGKILPDDDIYGVIYHTLANISELDEDANEDDIRERINEMEPDVYTGELTAWLNRNAGNVYYLTQALEETEQKDGFQLLSYAQYLFIQEYANAVLSELESRVEEE